jgi:hypothetical protein
VPAEQRFVGSRRFGGRGVRASQLFVVENLLNGEICPFAVCAVRSNSFVFICLPLALLLGGIDVAPNGAACVDAACRRLE